jgi:uncharacterized alpha-E superfamily protein
MLARTANGMYWLARYMERADYVARLLQVAQRMSAVRVDEDSSSEWESAIVAAGGREAYFERYDEVTPERAVEFLAFSADNPSSIRSCIATARGNARAIRTALTAEMWEAVNGTWLELAGFDARSMDEDQLADFVEWVKTRSALFHGVHSKTMLRRDGFHFARLGEFLERADNTARLLDVKYHVRLRDPEDVGGVIDYYQWLAILRVVAARRAYRVLFSGRVAPRNVAELLILRLEFPRSLAFCFEQITATLDRIQNSDASRSAEANRQANAMYAQLRYGRIDHIFDTGLHEYLTDFIERTEALTTEIAQAHHF